MNLAGKRLKYVDFEDSNLANANLEDAKIIWSNFAGADLTGANLRGTDLGRCFLLEAKLINIKVDSRTNFRGAIMDDRDGGNDGFASRGQRRVGLYPAIKVELRRRFAKIVFRVRFKLARLARK
jgi:uncharacterized protein YjbI with pentapeptide repeats